MNCENIKERLFEYINGELDEIEYKNISDHLKECESCREEYEMLLGMSEAINDAQYEAPQKLHTSVMKKVRREKIKEIVKRSAARAALVAACVAVVIISVRNFVPKFEGGSSEKPNKDETNPVQRPSENVNIKADNLFELSGGSVVDTDHWLTAANYDLFVGTWKTELDRGYSLTMEINGDCSVVVCIENDHGIKNYFDGKLEFKGNRVVLSQSDGVDDFYGVIKAGIKNGILHFDLVSGNTPWMGET